jgi:hypothetical protein
MILLPPLVLSRRPSNLPQGWLDTFKEWLRSLLLFALPSSSFIRSLSLSLSLSLRPSHPPRYHRRPAAEQRVSLIIVFSRGALSYRVGLLCLTSAIRLQIFPRSNFPGTRADMTGVRVLRSSKYSYPSRNISFSILLIRYTNRSQFLYIYTYTCTCAPVCISQLG